ncbi:MAG: HDOD domain-containing protein [Granulosicoccus sp.]|nr:HDOD domain-containing protein [Granulosicoccus sp.]
MTTIAFVDQDPALAQSLSGSVLSDYSADQESPWTWHFMETAGELLTHLQMERVDCVVSDMQASLRDGAQLLNHIAIQNPHTVRIALSSQVDAEMTLESLHATHRFIAKPTDCETVIEAIHRSLALHQKLSDRTLRSLVASITSLPVLPDIYNQLMTEMASSNFSIEAIGRIIESDISLSATLLKVVNSPYYGLVQHVESPTHAANLLGVELVKNILLCEKVLSQFKPDRRNEKAISELNTQARIRGVLANRFARVAKFRKRQIDHCQIAGMLGSLGDLVIQTGMVDPVVDENTTYHADQIGSSILGLWSLPDPVVEAVLTQRQEASPNGTLTVAHVLHALRRLDALFANSDRMPNEKFSMADALPDSTIDATLQRRWFDCYCDFHSDLQQAA